jgi:hypothetical protein
MASFMSVISGTGGLAFGMLVFFILLSLFGSVLGSAGIADGMVFWSRVGAPDAQSHDVSLGPVTANARALRFFVSTDSPGDWSRVDVLELNRRQWFGLFDVPGQSGTTKHGSPDLGP